MFPERYSFALIPYLHVHSQSPPFSNLWWRPCHGRCSQGQKQERTQKPPSGGHPVSSGRVSPSAPPRPPPGHGSHLRGSTQPWTAGWTVGHSLEIPPITWAEEEAERTAMGQGIPKIKTRGETVRKKVLLYTIHKTLWLTLPSTYISSVNISNQLTRKINYLAESAWA